MKTTNYSYTTELTSQSKKPRVTLAISFDNDDTDIVYVTSHDDGIGPDGELVIQGALLKDSLSNNTQKLDIDKSTSTIGQLTFSLIDRGGALSTLIGTKENAGFGLRRKRVSVYSGFKDQDWSEYEEDSAHIIENQTQDELVFNFTCTDVHRLTRTKIFTPTIQNLRQGITANEKTFSLAVTGIVAATKTVTVTPAANSSALDFEIGAPIDLATTLNTGLFSIASIVSETELTVVEAVVDEGAGGTAGHTLRIQLTGSLLTNYQTVEHDSQYSVWPSDTVGLVSIDGEIFLHDGPVDDATYGYHIPVRENGRGVLDTPTIAHEVEIAGEVDSQPEVTEVFLIEGAAPKLALAILTGQLYGQTGTLPDNMHCAVPAKFIRTADFVNIGSDLWNTVTDQGRNLQFITTTEVSAKDFLEKQVMLWMGCFMVIHTDGSLGLKKIPSMNSLTGYVATIDGSVTYKRESLKRDMNKVLNQLRVNWGKIALEAEYTKTTVLIDADSIATHQLGSPKTYNFDGVRLAANTDEDIRNYMGVWRDLYASPPYIFTATVAYRMMKVEVGDAVRVILPQHKDVIKGGTFDRVMLVTSAVYNPISGDLRFSLIGPSASPTPLLPVNASVKLDAGYYTPPSPARELGQAIIDGGGLISAGVITQSATLTGSADMNSLNSVFYYAGNLTIADGVVVSTFDNVNFRIDGHFTKNGGIQSIGSSNTGGLGEVATYTVTTAVGDTITTVEDMDNFLVGDEISFAWNTGSGFTGNYFVILTKPTANSVTVSFPDGGTLPATNAVYVSLSKRAKDPVTIVDLLSTRMPTTGVSGVGKNIGVPGVVFYNQYTGEHITLADAYYGFDGLTNGSTPEAAGGIGEFTRHLNLVNNGTEIGGIPDKFTGSGGTGGTSNLYAVRSWSLAEGPRYMTVGNGGNGGAGGSGILEVCKGASFGPNGFVDLSGEAGNAGQSIFSQNQSFGYTHLNNTFVAGAGVGGNPGAYYVVYDGEYTAPNLEGKVTSQLGNTPFVGVRGNSISSNSFRPVNTETYRAYYQGSAEFIYTSDDAYFQYMPSNLAPAPAIPNYVAKPATISLLEVVNSPASSQEILNTIEITVTAPSDTAYSHAEVYYRLYGNTNWTYLGPVAGASGEIVHIVSANGDIWEYQARPVSITGVESDTGISSIITSTDIVSAPPSEPQLLTWLPLDQPSTLALLGGGISFTGRSCHIVWKYNVTADTPPEHFLTYKVEVYNAFGADVLKRTFETTDPWFEYTEQMGIEDGGPYRELRFDVTAVGKQGHETAATTITVTNPQAGVPATADLSTLFSALSLIYTLPAEPDLAGILVYLSNSPAFTADANTLVYEGQDTSLYLTHFAAAGILSPMVPGTTYYVRYGLYDSFDQVGVTLSAEAPFVPEQVSAADDIQGLSNWATEITPADQAFIDANVGANAISSARIASIVAGKIATGTLSAQLTVSGLITTSATSWRVDMGPVIDGPDTFVLRYHDGAGNSKFSIDSIGNVAIEGAIAVTNPATVRTAINVADGATAVEGTTWGFNGAFDWIDGNTYPDNWGAWVGNPVRETATVRLGTTAVRFVCTGTDYGIQRTHTLSSAPPLGSFVTGSIDMYLEAYTSGGTGLLIDVGYDATFERTFVPRTTSTVGSWATIPFTAKVPTNKLITYIRIYLMGSFSGMPGGPLTGTVIFDALTLRLDNLVPADIGYTGALDADVTQAALIVGTTITGGGITLSAGGNIKGGQTSYDTGTGFFLGYEAGAYLFSIGNGTDRVSWDGTSLKVAGDITITNPATVRTDINVSDGADVTQAALIAGTTITGGGITLNAGGSVRSTGLTTEAVDVTAGVFLGRNGSNYTFGVGNGDEKYIKYDGTDLILGKDIKLRGGDSYSNQSIYYHTFFDSIDKFLKVGTTAVTAFGATITATTSQLASLQSGFSVSHVLPTWAKNRKFKITMIATDMANAVNGSNAFVTTGDTGGGSSNSMGFRLSWNSTTSKFDIYGYSRSSSTSQTALIASVTPSTAFTLEVKYIAGTSATFYVNASSATPITTNLPTGTFLASTFLYMYLPVSLSSTTSLIAGEFSFLQDD